MVGVPHRPLLPSLPTGGALGCGGGRYRRFWGVIGAPPARMVGSNRRFQVLDFHWRSSEPGDVRYRSRQLRGKHLILQVSALVGHQRLITSFLCVRCVGNNNLLCFRYRRWWGMARTSGGGTAPLLIDIRPPPLLDRIPLHSPLYGGV